MVLQVVEGMVKKGILNHLFVSFCFVAIVFVIASV